MNPKPFDALNHFTVPFAISKKPPHEKWKARTMPKKP
jgi:hypothetical protein